MKEYKRQVGLAQPEQKAETPYESQTAGAIISASQTAGQFASQYQQAKTNADYTAGKLNLKQKLDDYNRTFSYNAGADGTSLAPTSGVGSEAGGEWYVSADWKEKWEEEADALYQESVEGVTDPKARMALDNEWDSIRQEYGAQIEDKAFELDLGRMQAVQATGIEDMINRRDLSGALSLIESGNGTLQSPAETYNMKEKAKYQIQYGTQSDKITTAYSDATDLETIGEAYKASNQGLRDDTTIDDAMRSKLMTLNKEMKREATTEYNEALAIRVDDQYKTVVADINNDRITETGQLEAFLEDGGTGEDIPSTRHPALYSMVDARAKYKAKLAEEKLKDKESGEEDGLEASQEYWREHLKEFRFGTGDRTAMDSEIYKVYEEHPEIGVDWVEDFMKEMDTSKGFERLKNYTYESNIQRLQDSGFDEQTITAMENRFRNQAYNMDRMGTGMAFASQMTEEEMNVMVDTMIKEEAYKKVDDLYHGARQAGNYEEIDDFENYLLEGESGHLTGQLSADVIKEHIGNSMTVSPEALEGKLAQDLFGKEYGDLDGKEKDIVKVNKAYFDMARTQLEFFKNEIGAEESKIMLDPTDMLPYFEVPAESPGGGTVFYKLRMEGNEAQWQTWGEGGWTRATGIEAERVAKAETNNMLDQAKRYSALRREENANEVMEESFGLQNYYKQQDEEKEKKTYSGVSSFMQY